VGNNITINYNAVDSQKSDFQLNQSESEALDAGVTIHKGAHAGNAPGVFSFLGMSFEHTAYYNESVTYQGLHNTDRPFGLWNESWLGVDRQLLEQRRESAIQDNIHPERTQQQKSETPQ
jgi:hypothetical protein